ncbi:MFS transporter [Luteipulveratus halotolerans]|uniref:MFS transporter n=1 Tax=Luteipulveratus halotolerans TaxID=1631356 RepID=A0A0L6CDV4_9MICO|nr:MFS transporter [Luteipulveratus halotolerans]KNX36051.1 MFS transporter [Luteipulveratus halotolerans]
MKMAESWEALQDKRFRWFFIARATSLAGSSMAPVALAFAVLHVDKRASALATVMTGRMVALVVFLLIGGVVADRMSRRRVIQVSHALTAITQGSVAALIITGVATIPMILVIECVNGAVSAFTMPSMQGLVPQLVEPRLLQQANALMSFARYGTQILGPVVAGLIVAGPGGGWALAVDSLTYVIAIVALARIALPPAAHSGESMLADLREGWQEFASRTWLWVIVVGFGVLNAMTAGAWAVLGPYIAETDPTLGVRGWSLVLSAQAAGAIVMTLVLMRTQLNRPLRSGMIGVALMGAPIFVLGVRPMTLLLMPIAFVAGVGTEAFGTGWSVAMMENVPEHAQSRVWSYDMLGSFVAIPIGTTVFGWLATATDPSRIVAVTGVAYTVIALGILLVPSVRNLGRVKPVATEASSLAG